MSSISPSIGRKVWFFDSSGVGVNDDTQPFDATVIYVWGPTCVNLRVTDHHGNTTVRSSVPLRDPQPDDRHGREYVATWMPYQVGQAAKHGA